MKKIVALVALAALLGGCSSAPKENVTSCKQAMQGIEITSNFISDESGKVLRLEQSSTQEIPEDQIELAKESLEAQKASSTNMDGVTLEYTMNGNVITANVTYDLAKLSDDMLLQFGFVDDFKDENGNINIDKVTELYTTIGIECTAK